MDEDHQDRVGNTIWLPPLSPRDQERLERLRKKRTKANDKRIGFSGKNMWDWLNLLGVLAIPFVIAAGTLFITERITQQQDQASAAQHQIC